MRIVRDACHGLDYAHRAGVVHRDVKPGNLLVAAETGTTKLADFGIAKAAEQTRITQVGSVLGTAAYLSPEQARGDEAGPPSDIYSLGVCAYQFLAGRLPHEYSSLTELALKQQDEAVEPITDPPRRRCRPRSTARSGSASSASRPPATRRRSSWPRRSRPACTARTPTSPARWPARPWTPTPRRHSGELTRGDPGAAHPRHPRGARRRGVPSRPPRAERPTRAPIAARSSGPGGAAAGAPS